MDPIFAALLGLVQALTEFLPVSSSGHLVLGKTVLGIEGLDGAAFEVAVHFGTLLSVLVLFRREVVELIGATLRSLRHPTRFGEQWRADPTLRLAGAIVIGCIPAGLVGILFKDELEAAFGAPRLVGFALVGTGLLLLASRLAPKGDEPVTLARGLIIGIAQAVAILPGVSRSGSTIATAQFLRVDAEVAARYSFLLSLPVIAGASALKARELLAQPPPAELINSLVIGGVVSFVAGLAALWLLMGVVRRGWFAHFGWYCLLIGGWVIARA